MVSILSFMGNNKNNKERIDFILSHLNRKEKDDFLKEILEASLLEKDVSRIMFDWEATAEVNADPLLKKKILLRVKSLKKFLLHSHNV